jgi:hypothetical protein
MELNVTWGLYCIVTMERQVLDGCRWRIGGLWLSDDVARLHVKIDNLNDLLVGFCFIRSIDELHLHRLV